MALLDLQEMELPEAPSGALIASWSGDSSYDDGSGLSLLLCG